MRLTFVPLTSLLLTACLAHCVNNKKTALPSAKVIKTDSFKLNYSLIEDSLPYQGLVGVKFQLSGSIHFIDSIQNPLEQIYISMDSFISFEKSKCQVVSYVSARHGLEPDILNTFIASPKGVFHIGGKLLKHPNSSDSVILFSLHRTSSKNINDLLLAQWKEQAHRFYNPNSLKFDGKYIFK